LRLVDSSTQLFTQFFKKVCLYKSRAPTSLSYIFGGSQWPWAYMSRSAFVLEWTLVDSISNVDGSCRRLSMFRYCCDCKVIALVNVQWLKIFIYYLSIIIIIIIINKCSMSDLVYFVLVALFHNPFVSTPGSWRPFILDEGISLHSPKLWHAFFIFWINAPLSVLESSNCFSFIVCCAFKSSETLKLPLEFMISRSLYLRTRHRFSFPLPTWFPFVCLHDFLASAYMISYCLPTWFPFVCLHDFPSSAYMISFCLPTWFPCLCLHDFLLSAYMISLPLPTW